MNQPNELSRLAHELVRLSTSENVTEQAFYTLYRQGRIKPNGIRNNRIVWIATEENTND